MPVKKIAIENSAESPYLVTDENGKTYILHGYGAGKLRHLDIDPRIDLTKPIWDQVQRLARRDKKQSREAA